MTHPACIMGLLIHPVMKDGEAVGIIGAVQETVIIGFKSSLRFDSVIPHHRRKQSTLTAIDALSFKRVPPGQQWSQACIERELAKVSLHRNYLFDTRAVVIGAPLRQQPSYRRVVEPRGSGWGVGPHC